MADTKILTYRGKPLVRQGNFLFYGNPDDKAILFLSILDSKKVGETNIATRVLVQIQSTDDSLSYNQKIIKQVEKQNFYDAFEIGSIWLERELNKK